MKPPVQEPCCNLPRTSSAMGDVPRSGKQKSERRLDDEALLRMDDEGGANSSVRHADAGEKTARAAFLKSNQLSGAEKGARGIRRTWRMYRKVSIARIPESHKRTT